MMSKLDYAALGVHPTKSTRNFPSDLAELRYWQNDVVGPQAIVEAALDLRAGKIVRFAKLKLNGNPGNGWAVDSIVAFQLSREDDDTAYMPYRIHDHDGDPIHGDGSHAVQFYPARAINPVAELSVAMAIYLGHWMRLQNRT